jgi:hypothetical protein
MQLLSFGAFTSKSQSGGVGQHARDLGLACPESGGERGLLGCVAFHLVQQDFVGLVEYELHSR